MASPGVRLRTSPRGRRSGEQQALSDMARLFGAARVERINVSGNPSRHDDPDLLSGTGRRTASSQSSQFVKKSNRLPSALVEALYSSVYLHRMQLTVLNFLF